MRFELTTSALRKHCSTTELRWHFVIILPLPNLLGNLHGDGAVSNDGALVADYGGDCQTSWVQVS